jgi:GntR family transcriptional repressor for pyruvate dehydrogenase complex
MDNKELVEFGTFEKDVLSQKIANRILSLIREKRLHPGDRLPPERELADIMQVSRPSLREALRALSIMGIIRNRQGSGTYIASLKPSRLIEHLDFILSIDDSSFLDLFEARRILETGLAGMAASKITDEQIAGLEEILVRCEQTLDDPAAFLQADLDLHQKIAEISCNRILSIFMHSINDLGLYSRQRTGELPEVRDQTLVAHREIVRSIKARDPIAAANAMRKHLDEVEEWLKQLVGPVESR